MSKRRLPSLSSNSLALEPEVAITLLVLFSAAADGEGISVTEENAVNEFLSEVSLFEDYSEEDFQALTEKVNSLLDQTAPEDLIASAIASLPNEEYREAVYITAILIVGIDGEVPESEKEYISELQAALDISDERSQELIDEVFKEEEEE